RWVYEPPARPRGAGGGRRSWRAVGLDARETVERIAFPELGENAVTAGLVKLDRRLNPVLGELAAPSQGLRRWDGLAWAPLPTGFLETVRGRVLVLVHGTFSASAMYTKEFAVTADGEALFDRLTRAGDRKGEYSAVLAFDHPTLSVAPWLNALALRDALAGCRAELDFVGHSRGGLVIAWLLRLAPTLPVRQALFVGSPLAGTSLAAPDKIRQALDTLASISGALAEGAARVGRVVPGLEPLSLGVAGLACVLGKVLQLGSRTPLADAAVGLVPGLLAQGRVANNLELAQLWPLPAGVEVRAIGGSFRPSETDEPLWKLWKRITNLQGQAMYYGADLIFDQPNDLVVDSAAMHQLGSQVLAAPHWEDLGVSAETHHTNYFQDARVLNWLDRRLR
ncbi:MAG: esterase/lipase family protein, partial [Roseateles sp.]